MEFLKFDNSLHSWREDKVEGKSVKIWLDNNFGVTFAMLAEYAKSLPEKMPYKKELMEIFTECDSGYRCYANPSRFNHVIGALFVLLDMSRQKDMEISALSSKLDENDKDVVDILAKHKEEIDLIVKRHDEELKNNVDGYIKDLDTVNRNCLQMVNVAKQETASEKDVEYNNLAKENETLQKRVEKLEHLVFLLNGNIDAINKVGEQKKKIKYMAAEVLLLRQELKV